jgi:hypothetical protein
MACYLLICIDNMVVVAATLQALKLKFSLHLLCVCSASSQLSQQGVSHQHVISLCCHARSKQNAACPCAIAVGGGGVCCQQRDHGQRAGEAE